MLSSYHMSEIVSTQSMNYRPMGPGPLKMIKCFQDAIDYRASLNGKATKDIFTKMGKYIKSKVYPKLQGILLDEYGIVLTRLFSNQFMDVRGMDIKIMPIIGNEKISEHITLTQLGYKSLDKKVLDHYVSQVTKEKTAKALSSISKTLDKDKHTFKFDPKKSIFRISAMLWLPAGFFSMGDLIGDDKFYLTADEMTAIVHHELGHIVTLAEFASWTVARNRILSEASEQFTRTAPIKEQLDYINRTLGDTKIKKEVTQITDKIIALENSVTTSKKVINAIVLILANVTLLVHKGIGPYIQTNSLVDTISAILGTYVGVDIGTSVVDIISVEKRTTKTKRGDSPLTTSSIETIEKDADEFATRVGLSAAIASAMVKINNFYLSIDPESRLMAVGQVSRKIASFNHGIHLLFGSGNRQWHTVHPEDFERLQNIYNDVLKSFRHIEDKDYKRYAVKQVEDTLKIIEKYRSNHSILYSITQFRNFIDQYSSIETLYLSIRNGSFFTKYSELARDIDIIDSNKMWYQGEKLKILSE
ncbi:MAG: hypothetical protein GY804_08625 [Alphaproteobacteria bacterium]|nr:hypothetical protein [Alphaproteobacteria bacterium]